VLICLVDYTHTSVSSFDALTAKFCCVIVLFLFVFMTLLICRVDSMLTSRLYFDAFTEVVFLLRFSVCVISFVCCV
jgi:hypothetical protein